MRITQNGDTVIATHVTGPTHNFLSFSLQPIGSPHGGEPMFLYDEPTAAWPIASVKEAVLKGIKAAGGSGAACIRSIRVLGNDTPWVDVYEWLALRLTQHLSDEQANATLQKVAD